jgi:hypothetical protein
MNALLRPFAAAVGEGACATTKPWWQALGVVAVTALLFVMSMRPGWVFSYPLDDTYIHMALAKTLAQFGVWGVSPQSPAAASSSPFWTLLLAFSYRLTAAMGPLADLYTPLLWNLVFAVALVHLNARILGGLPHAPLLLLVSWLCSGLPGVVAIGMEHVAHTLFITLFLYETARRLGQAQPWLPSRQEMAWLALLTALAATSRYESAFVIAPIVLISMKRGAWRAAWVMTAATAIPLLAFGAVWVHAGGWLLPNSLLLKGAGNAATTDVMARLGALLAHVRYNLETRASWVPMALFALNLALRVYLKPVHATVSLFSSVSLVSSVVHLCLASFGWLYRYDAWIVQLNVLSIFLQLPARALPTWALKAVPLLCIGLLIPRFYGAYDKTPMAMDDRRWEHLMPSQFVRQHLADQTVLVNDLGAIAYYGGANVVDLFGLGRNEPIRYRNMPGGYQRAQVKAFADSLHGDVAIVQLCWSEVSSRLPLDWHFVGYWQGTRNVVFSDMIVAVFVMDDDKAASTRQALRGDPPYRGVQLVTQGVVQQYNLSPISKRAAMIDALCKG